MAGKHPMCVNWCRNNCAELATYFKYPYGIIKLIYKTNTMENFNKQLRKAKKQNNISKRLRTTKKPVSSDGRCFK
ncbi:MAG: transposase [Finegoldia magna]|nr:transposase [Finegoldia magna]